MTFNDFIFLFMQLVKINRDVRVEFNSYYELFMKKLDIFVFWKKMGVVSKNLPRKENSMKNNFFLIKNTFLLSREILDNTLFFSSLNP